MDINTDYEHVKRVVESCKTKEQLENAYNLIEIFNNKWHDIFRKSGFLGIITHENLLTLIEYRNKLDTIWWSLKLKKK